MVKYALLLSTALVASSAAMAAHQLPPFHAPKHAPKGAVVVRDAHGAMVTMGTNGSQVGHISLINPNGAISKQLWGKKTAAYVPFYAYSFGCYSGGYYCYKEAESFIPASSTTTKSVTTGIMTTGSCSYYTCNATISINADNGGIPGAVLDSQNVTVTTPYGSCCAGTTVQLHAPLTAGTRYWVVASGASSSDLLDWAIQDGDYVDTNLHAYDFSYNGTDYGWYSYSNTQGYSLLVK